MKQKRLYLLYNVFVLIVQHCYLLYNIVTNVQHYNLYNLDKKIVQFTKGFAKVSINILFCIVQSVVQPFRNLFNTLYNIRSNLLYNICKCSCTGCTGCTGWWEVTTLYELYNLLYNIVTVWFADDTRLVPPLLNST